MLLFPFDDSQAQTTDICERTPQIEAKILDQLGLVESDCASVPTESLAGIKTIFAGSLEISALEEGDFAGLDGLEGLYLPNNNLTSVPEDLFDGLVNLETLHLHANSLTNVPE